MTEQRRTFSITFSAAQKRGKAGGLEPHLVIQFDKPEHWVAFDATTMASFMYEAILATNEMGPQFKQAVADKIWEALHTMRGLVN